MDMKQGKSAMQCVNCPGRNDHDTADCPVMKYGQLDPQQRLDVARGTGDKVLIERELLERVCREDGASNDMALEELRALLTAQPQASARSCVCGEPESPGIHRNDGPCYANLPQASAAQSAPDLQRLESVLDDVCSKEGGVFPGVPIYSISLTEVAEAFRIMTAQSAPAGGREASFEEWAAGEGYNLMPGMSGYLIRETKEAYRGFCAAWQRTQSAGVPEGYVLVPQSMYLDAASIEAMAFVMGGPEEDDGSPTYCDCVMWVGEIDDDGVRRHGIHVYNTECEEEGSTTLAEFAAAPAQPAAQDLCNCPAGSKPEPHKHAPNCPYRTGAAAHYQGDQQEDLHVWRATTRIGYTCHFGEASAARAWAGENGTIERVDLTPVPDLQVVERHDLGEVQRLREALNTAKSELNYWLSLNARRHTARAIRKIDAALAASTGQEV